MQAGCCTRPGVGHKRDSAWSWLVCFSALVTNSIILGIQGCFAVFVPVLLKHFNEGKEKTAWVGSVSLSLTFFATPLAGWFCNRFSCRVTAIIGALACATAAALTSFVDRLMFMYLSYSLLYGLGACFLHTSSILITNKYFFKRKALAMSIAGAGAHVGLLAAAPLVQLMIDNVGWRNVFRGLAGTFGVVLMLVLTYDPNVEVENLRSNDVLAEQAGDEREKPTFSLAMFKNPRYVIAVFSLFLGAFGAFIVNVHLVEFCIEVGVSSQDASNLFIFIGIASLFSAVTAGYVCGLSNNSPFYVNQTANLVLGLCYLTLPMIKSYKHLMILSTFYGIGAGSFITTIYVLLLTNVDPKIAMFGYPVGESIVSIGTGTGSPFAGFLADVTGSYPLAFYACGGVLVFAAFIPFLIHCFKSQVHLTEPHRKEGLDEEPGTAPETTSSELRERLGDGVVNVGFAEDKGTEWKRNDEEKISMDSTAVACEVAYENCTMINEDTKL